MNQSLDSQRILVVKKKVDSFFLFFDFKINSNLEKKISILFAENKVLCKEFIFRYYELTFLSN